MSAKKRHNHLTKNNSSGYSITHGRFSFHQGPLPSPETLFQYDQIAPGSAQSLINMFELQVKHRQDLEKSVIDADIKSSKTGMWLGFIIATAGIISGTICILQSFAISGTIIGGGSLTGLVSVFVYGSYQRRKEREINANQIQGK